MYKHVSESISTAVLMGHRYQRNLRLVDNDSFRAGDRKGASAWCCSGCNGPDHCKAASGQGASFGSEPLSEMGHAVINT